MPTYQLTTQIFLDKDCYKKIIVINKDPSGALASFVKKIKGPKLSPFQSNNCCENTYCQRAILNPHQPTDILCMSQIGLLFSFLLDNGYTINTHLTEIMQPNLDNLICFFSI